ncbi:triose-phosphate isomerase [Rhabdothermincola salaria]|uniref:triose-phosphate isomerase n=1 Tax=Rhabdothermincola salaria TaxID=2903142 RepID=UPI001E3ABE40|nr:triose-phosphate isomerase [Rhabdothermincola salaria]MCD9622598.1 triose-phosphate isomerase [Rhabdothermincola salaria]
MPAERKPLISGNWKMNLNHFEATATLDKLRYLLAKDDYEVVDVSVHPPFTDIRTVQTFLESEKVPIAIGAQNCHWEDKGAYTGEVAPPMLAKLNVAYVIVGHSERREIFGETDVEVGRKVKAVFTHGMTPILCCGETLEEREGEAHHGKITGQVHAGIEVLTAEQVATMVIAYEPIWAIGTGRTASADDAQEVCGWIRAKVADMKGADAAAAVRIQYGGSVKAANAAELMGQPDIDGALVGGAALDPDEFAKIVQFRLA